MDGTVARLVRDRGFGFVTTRQGQEYFFHRSACQPGTNYDQLTEGDPVTFEGGDSPKGLRVTSLHLVARG